MRTLSQILLLVLLTPNQAISAENVSPPLPPPPPNPFSNLPPGGAEGFTPFDDDFDNFSKSAGGASDFAPPSGSNPSPLGSASLGNSSSGSRSSGNNAAASFGKSSRLPPPATCKEIVENFDYPDAEILDVAKAIAKLTGKNFIYNPQDIKGRISVVSQTQITVCDALNAFLAALNMRGFALVPTGKYLRIERIANAKEKQTYLGMLEQVLTGIL